MKKNSQYYHKRRVMSALHPKPTKKAIAASKMALDILLGAAQLAVILRQPRPKYPSGAIEPICTDDQFKDAKLYIKP